jgi:hypothetical protein
MEDFHARLLFKSLRLESIASTPIGLSVAYDDLFTFKLQPPRCNGETEQPTVQEYSFPRYLNCH